MDLASKSLTQITRHYGIDTEAVFSLGDPMPGLMEMALTPYLAVRRGL